MKNLAIVFAVLLLTMAPRTSAQDAQRLERKFPKLEAYAATPDVLLLARYAADGQFCELVMQPRHWVRKTMRVDPTLSQKEIVTLVEDLVPESQRGKKDAELSSGMLVISGATFSSTVKYEKMNIIFAGSSKELGAPTIALVEWPERHCDK